MIILIIQEPDGFDKYFVHKSRNFIFSGTPARKLLEISIEKRENLQYTKKSFMCQEKAMGTMITSVDRHSPAWKAGIQAGERLLSIGGHPVEDVLDYRFYGYDPNPALVLETSQGEKRCVRVRKEEGADLGLNFDTYLMDTPRACGNHCLFCFVDQMAPGCRETLYFKDDDARLSFLLGNYITLTNLSPREVQRIIDLRISPLNISVHTTNPALRRMLLGNKNADKSLAWMEKFGKSGILMNGQIVLCPGLNDGAELQRTMEDMTAWKFASCSVVPVGLTKYREKLAKLQPVTKEKAVEVIDQVEAFGAQCLAKYGSRMFFCSDEFYIRAGRPLPEESYYEGYIQLENGVGMLRSLIEEFLTGLQAEGKHVKASRFTIATGVSARPFLQELLERAAEKTGIQGQVMAIENDFFGHTIDVAGLITGRDLIAQLTGKDLGARLLIPVNMLRHGGDVFLDDTTVPQVEQALHIPITVVEQDGYALLDAMLER